MLHQQSGRLKSHTSAAKYSQKTTSEQFWNYWPMGKLEHLHASWSFQIQHMQCSTPIILHEGSENPPRSGNWDLMRHFTGESVMNNPHLSMTPAHLTPPFHTALQADGAPWHKVFDLHTHPTTHVPDLQNKNNHFSVYIHSSSMFLVWPLGVHPGCPDDGWSMQEKKATILCYCRNVSSLFLVFLVVTTGNFGIIISNSMHIPLLSTWKTPTSFSFLIV